MKRVLLATLLCSGCVSWHKGILEEESLAFRSTAETCREKIATTLQCDTFETCPTGVGFEDKAADALRAMNHCLTDQGWVLH